MKEMTSIDELAKLAAKDIHNFVIGLTESQKYSIVAIIAAALRKVRDEENKACERLAHGLCDCQTHGRIAARRKP